VKVSVDVYTKDVDAALEAFKRAIQVGATDVTLSSSEHYETQRFEYVNLRFDAEANSPAISHLDQGPFVSEYSAL
jgi:hypothetical protein